MKHKDLLLLKTLLLSTSGINVFRYTKDKKKKSRIIAGYVGLFFLYAMIVGYSIMTSIGFGASGMTGVTPGMCAIILSTIGFIFTLFKTNGYLFNFREYDMLMSLPFECSSVAGCKFLYMYIKTLPWYLSIGVAMLVGYGIFAHPPIITYVMWVIMTLLLPIIPMLAASFAGFLIARISTGFKKKSNILQTVLTFIFVIFCFSLRYIIEAMFKNDMVEATLEKAAEITANIGAFYLPVGWFSDAVVKGSIVAFILLTAVISALFILVFRIVGRSYRNINSALRSHAAARNYKMTSQKKRSVVNAIAFKEFRRMTSSTLYITNAALGCVLTVILGVLTLVIGFDSIINIVTQGAPVDSKMLQPAIPFIVYFLVGMLATTAVSPSLEGRNYWIVQSLPIEKKVLYQGKMLFNLYLSVPFMIFGTLCLCISSRTSPMDTLLYLILGTVLCMFSTAWGCVCGIRHMKLDWENEVEVIKQGPATAVYLLPNMFVVMGLTALVVFLGLKMNHSLLAVIFIVIAGILAALSYLRVMSLSKK